MFDRREYMRLWVANRRAEWFKDKSCVKCGSEENLEIHHVDPATKVAHQVWTWAKERRDEELSKCEVLCSDCHSIETLWQNVKFEHGTRVMYMRHKCRCDLCVEAARKYREEQRVKRGRKHQKSYNAVVAQAEEHLSCKQKRGFSTNPCGSILKMHC
jgi:hypothetical protein